jgi:hydrogenase nickel incorporation protein HypA/HybF
MHERSLVHALLRQVERIAIAHPANRVVQIRIRVGEFAGVEPDLLMMAYDDVIEESPFRGAELALERVPLTATCDNCGRMFRIERFDFRCDACGSRQLSVQGGEEMLLESVVMEENEL